MPPRPTKPAILRALLDALRARLERNRSLASHAAASATHDQAKAEDKYDTRGLELTYLAAGATDRVEELRRVLAQYAFWSLPDTPMTTIVPGALVGLEDDDGREKTVFLAPFGDGESLEVEGASIQAVTLRAPLGAALLGKEQGDEVTVRVAGALRQWYVQWLQ